MTVNEFARKLHKADAKERGRLYDSATEFLSSRKAAIDAIEGTVSVDRAMTEAYPADETFRVNVLKAEKALKTLRETP